jgi:serine O-acetyltransferase
MAQWLADYRQDIKRYTQCAGKSTFRKTLLLLATEQGLWALLQYRVSAAARHTRLPGPTKKILDFLLLSWRKLIEILTGISLPDRASIGPGIYLGHFGPIVVHLDARIGHTCNISQGVTIGVTGKGAGRGVPTLGNRVYIGVSAVVVGKITIDDDAVIGANSLVDRHVQPHTTVVRVPARPISREGSDEYISPSHALLPVRR